MSERAFDFLGLNDRGRKPRTRGITEIRGPYYTPMGARYLRDVLETMGAYIDILKFGGGSFALLPRDGLSELLQVCHEFGVKVSTGGFIEFALTRGGDAVDRYLARCKELGFDIVEISAGFVTLPEEDFARLVRKARDTGLVPKPEVGIQFGAGGASGVEQLESLGTRDVASAIRLARRCLDAGAELIMVESEGITENVRQWRTDVIDRLVDALGIEKLMFEAADPEVFSWYVRSYGPDVNLFVDHSQIVQLECLRSGIWGRQDAWGRVVTYKPK